MSTDNNWLCLDCGKDTLHSKGDYYMLRNRLWRQLVPREQRHGMLCLACVESRLGRPLVSEDFRVNCPDMDESDPMDAPMSEADYGIYDSLSPETLRAIDATLLSYASLSHSRKVGALVKNTMTRSAASVPGLHDWFYIDRVMQMIDNGILTVMQEGERPVNWVVCLARESSVEG
jgi:hypothetical protein